jgi:hypothetical protein
MASKYTRKYTGKVLESYKKIMAEEMKRQLNKPGSNLEKSIEGRKVRGVDGFGIYMNEYGINVNQGRSAGELPNLYNIQDWIQRNTDKLNIKDQRPSTIKKLTFAIGNTIQKRGILPTRFIDIVIERFEPRLTLDLVDAYRRDLMEELDKSTPNAKKG